MTDSVARSSGVLPLSPLRGTELRRQNADVRSAATPNNRVPVIDRDQVPPEIRKAAEGMEAMFLDLLMKSMRETVPQNEMDMENQASGIYRGMMDSEVAEKAAHLGGSGIADTLIAYLQGQSYTQGQAMKAEASRPSGALPTASHLAPKELSKE